MKNRVKCVLLLAVLLLAHPSLAAPRGWVEVKPKAVQTPTQSKIRGEISDAAGHRYAIRNDGTAGIVKWDGSIWQILPFETEKWSPERLAPLGDGIVCLWSKHTWGPSHGFLYRLSVHNGTTGRWLTHPPLETLVVGNAHYSPQFFPSGASQLLLAGQRRFYHILPDGKVVPLFKLTPDKVQRLGPPKNYSDRINPLHSLKDKRGGYWFWSNAWKYGERAFSLRGLLHFDGQKVTHITSLPNVPLTNRVVNTLTPGDKETFWLSVGKVGLFVFNPTTLQTRQVTDPKPGAFHYVQQITPQGRDLFVVAYEKNPKPDPEDDDRLGQLWRLRDGRWQLLINGLDRWASEEPNRPILSNASGVWFPSNERGVWLAPPQGAPVLLDWRYGLPFSSVTKLETHKDGSTLIEGWGARTFTARIVNLRQVLAQRPAPRVKAFKSYLPLAQDRGGRIWVVLTLRGKALSEWSGTRWIPHPLPGKYKPGLGGVLAFDRRNRVWILDDYRDGQVAIFDRAASGAAAWSVFPDYRTALVAQVGAKPPALPLLHGATRNGEDLPAATPESFNGQLAYFDYFNRLNYFDGKKWRRWTVQQIDPKSTSIYNDFIFSPSGTLRVRLSGDNWELTPQGWKSNKEAGSIVRNPSVVDTAAQLPNGVLGQNIYSTAVTDRQGYYYAVAKGQLYRVSPDDQPPRLVAPLFQPHENHPFADGDHIEEAYFDHLGNVFFQVTDNNIFLPASPSPDTRASARRVAVDAFDITATSAVLGSRWFVWRRAGRSWSAPQTSPTIKLREFLGGSHRVEVAVIDRYLHRDPTPAVVTIQVDIIPQAQIAGYIADLSSPDFPRREKAVAALARQPERSLPALKAERLKANRDLQWWIDAAVQAAEEAISW